MNHLLKFLVSLIFLAAVSHAAKDRPNFIFLIADDHRWDAMGAVQREHGENGRFPWFETPNMDRLAAEGVRFRNAFITHSICSPGRAGFLTGQYTHINGVMDNSTPFPEDSVTHATLLRGAGYRTAYFGKWHMGNQRARPGFDHAASYINQGIYQDCPFEINGVRTPTNGWVDDVTTDLAIDWLKQKHARPFSMVIGFKSPHNRRGAENLPERLRNLYEGQTTRRTPNCDLAAIYHKPLTAEDAGKERGLSANSVHLDYLRHIKGIDENLGRLLVALDELGISEETVVVYSSDNGYYLGERGLGDKRALYEEGLRIPFIIRYPRLFPGGKLIDDLVLNIDLAPTYLDLAGLPAHPAMQGVSFKEAARGNRPADWRTSFLSCYRKELGDVPTCVAIRTATAKLIHYHGKPEWTEAFDLSTDPYETKNLAHDPAFVGKLRKELVELATRVGYPLPPELVTSSEHPAKTLPLPGETFVVAGRSAFLILPDLRDAAKPTPWVWYAPTLPRLPAVEEKWMFEKFLAAGIGIAGIDVGESMGNPQGRKLFSALYAELVGKRGMAPKPCLLARSRGGLMLYNWAAENPQSVAAIAGVYPVGDLASWPGLAKAAGAYGITTEQLSEQLPAHNPIDRLAPLAKAAIPIFHVHGDADTVVPLDRNSGLIKQRYEALGGRMILEIIEGGGHDMKVHWFQNQALVDFVLGHLTGS